MRDGHVTESWEQPQRYLEAPYRQRSVSFPCFPMDGWDRRLGGDARGPGIFEGVPARFPRLRIAYLEAGAGWVPYFVQRMDEELDTRGHVEAPALATPPSEYVESGRIALSCEADEILLPYAIEYVGAEQIVHASGFPYRDHSYSKSLKELVDRPSTIPG
jgi:predicted TIM-barrel fold metal-dependent hydrolase